MNSYKLFLLGCISITIVGCGGGGGGSSAPESQKPSVTTYTVSAVAGEGGSVSPASQSVESGNNATITVTPDSGYLIAAVSGCNGTLDGTTYTTGAVTADCSVEASFKTEEVVSVDPVKARILYPWKVSRTGSDQILVKGVADSGAAKITVNGLEASITQATQVQSVKGMSRMPGVQKTSSGGEVTWEVMIPISQDQDVELVVNAEDASGNVNEAVDSASVLTNVVPMNFVLDKTGRRLVAQGLDDSNRLKFVTLGLDDGSYTVQEVSPGQESCHALEYLEQSEELVCGTIFESELKLDAINISDGTTRNVLTKDLNLDPAEWNHVYLSKLLLSPDASVIHLLLKYYSATDFQPKKSVLARFDLTTEVLETVVDGNVGTGESLRTDDIAYTAAGFLIFNDYLLAEAGFDALQVMDHAGASIEFLSSASNNNMLAAIDVDTAEQYAYLAGYNGIVKTDILSGEKSVLSSEAEEGIYNITQVNSTALDEEAGRLLVADDGYKYIVAVDTETGERSEFASNGVGGGKHLIWPRAFELDEASGVAYLLDDGGNAYESLIKVNLATGDREVVHAFSGAINYIARGLVLNRESHRLYAIFDYSIHEFDLAAGTFRLLAGTENGTGTEHFAAASLDGTNNRLLVMESNSKSMMAVDLVSGALSTVVSSEEYFTAPVGIEYDSEQNIAYVLSQSTGTLYSYDFVTGEILPRVSECRDLWGANIMDINFAGVYGLHVDFARNVAWMAGDGVLKHELGTDTCNVINTENARLHGTLDYATTSEGQLLATQANQLIQIDPEAADFVVISR